MISLLLPLVLLAGDDADAGAPPLRVAAYEAVVIATVADAKAADAVLKKYAAAPPLKATPGMPRVFGPSTLIGGDSRKTTVIAALCNDAYPTKWMLEPIKKKFPSAKTMTVWGPYAGACPDDKGEPRKEYPPKVEVLAGQLDPYRKQLAATELDPSDENIAELFLAAHRTVDAIKRVEATSALYREEGDLDKRISGLHLLYVRGVRPEYFWALAAQHGRDEGVKLFKLLSERDAGWANAWVTAIAGGGKTWYSLNKGYFSKSLAALNGLGPLSPPYARVADDQKRRILELFACPDCWCASDEELGQERDLAGKLKLEEVQTAIDALRKVPYREPRQCGDARRPDGD